MKTAYYDTYIKKLEIEHFFMVQAFYGLGFLQLSFLILAPNRYKTLLDPLIETKESVHNVDSLLNSCWPHCS